MISSSPAVLSSAAGSLNLVQMMGNWINIAASGMKKGVSGDTFSHSCAPIHGMGREIRLRLVENNPNAVPRSFSGTTFDISELYAGDINAHPLPMTIREMMKCIKSFPTRKTLQPIPINRKPLTLASSHSPSGLQHKPKLQLLAWPLAAMTFL